MMIRLPLDNLLYLMKTIHVSQQKLICKKCIEKIQPLHTFELEMDQILPRFRGEGFGPHLLGIYFVNFGIHFSLFTVASP